MPTTLTIRDETATGDAVREFSLDFLEEDVTVRELITRRVYEEVQQYNQNRPAVFQGLVQPTDAEQALNGYRLKRPREIDWERQRDLALEAFEANRFFILVDDRQVEALDENIHFGIDTRVSFVKLMPLIGG